jgi:hypothetical protein
MRPLSYFTLVALATAALVFGVPAWQERAEAQDRGGMQISDAGSLSSQAR